MIYYYFLIICLIEIQFALCQSESLAEACIESKDVSYSQSETLNAFIPFKSDVVLFIDESLSNYEETNEKLFFAIDKNVTFRNPFLDNSKNIIMEFQYDKGASIKSTSTNACSLLPNDIESLLEAAEAENSIATNFAPVLLSLNAFYTNTMIATLTGLSLLHQIFAQQDFEELTDWPVLYNGTLWENHIPETSFIFNYVDPVSQTETGDVPKILIRVPPGYNVNLGLVVGSSVFTIAGSQNKVFNTATTQEIGNINLLVDTVFDFDEHPCWGTKVFWPSPNNKYGYCQCGTYEDRLGAACVWDLTDKEHSGVHNATTTQPRGTTATTAQDRATTTAASAPNTQTVMSGLPQPSTVVTGVGPPNTNTQPPMSSNGFTHTGVSGSPGSPGGSPGSNTIPTATDVRTTMSHAYSTTFVFGLTQSATEPLPLATMSASSADEETEGQPSFTGVPDDSSVNCPVDFSTSTDSYIPCHTTSSCNNRGYSNPDESTSPCVCYPPFHGDTCEQVNGVETFDLPASNPVAVFRVPQDHFRILCRPKHPCGPIVPLRISAGLTRDPLAASRAALTLRTLSVHKNVVIPDTEEKRTTVCLKPNGVQAIGAVELPDCSDDPSELSMKDCSAACNSKPCAERDACFVAACDDIQQQRIARTACAAQCSSDECEARTDLSLELAVDSDKFSTSCVRRDGLVCATDVLLPGTDSRIALELVERPRVDDQNDTPWELLLIGALLLCCLMCLLVVGLTCVAVKGKRTKTEYVETGEVVTARTSQPTRRSTTEMTSYHSASTIATPEYDSVPPIKTASTSSGYTKPPARASMTGSATTDYSKAPSPRSDNSGYSAPPPPSSGDSELLNQLPDPNSYESVPAEIDQNSLVNSDYSLAPEPTSIYDHPDVENIQHGVIASSNDLKESQAEAVDIDFSKVEQGKAIGEGAFGKVYHGKYDGKTVAIKLLTLPDDENERNKALKLFHGECELMKRLPAHRHVLAVVGVCEDPPALLTEYCEGGSMDVFIRKHAISARKLLLFASDVASGLAHLHAHGVVHRDLAARNLLLTSKPRVLKVCDFGLARQITDNNTTKSAGGPVKWQPPETIVDGIYSKESDVWSFGVVVWEIAARRRPFEDLAPGTAAVAICKGTRLERVDIFSDGLWKLTKSCWRAEPSKRPSAQKLTEKIGALLADVGRQQN